MCGDNVRSNVLTHSFAQSFINSFTFNPYYPTFYAHLMRLQTEVEEYVCECNRRRMTLINYAKGCAYSGHMFPQFYTFLFCGRQKVKLLKITIPFCHRAQPPPPFTTTSCSCSSTINDTMMGIRGPFYGSAWSGLLTIFDTRYQLASIEQRICSALLCVSNKLQL